MSISIAYLGPRGTFSEEAATAYAQDQHENAPQLQPYPTIDQAIRATASGQSDRCVVPIENSIGGGVTITLDTLWESETLKIQQAFTLPVEHALISTAPSIGAIKTIYSHPQGLAQCRAWLGQHLPDVQQIRTSSTAEPLTRIKHESTAGAIASPWAARIYQLPILARPINDFADNHTRFWVLGKQPATHGDYTSLAFNLPTNEPGALLKPLQLFSALNLNMSRIESRPTKRQLGEYIFFVDLEASADDPTLKTALDVLTLHTATVKVFGSYPLKPLQQPSEA